MSATTTWIVQTTDATFDQDVLQRSRTVPVVVDFWAEWCRPCHLLAPMLERIAARFAGRFVLVKANTDQTQAAASQFRVQGIPAVFGFRDGELSDSFVGVPPESQIELWIEQLLPTEAEQHSAEANKVVQIDPQAAEQEYRKALELDAVSNTRGKTEFCIGLRSRTA